MLFIMHSKRWGPIEGDMVKSFPPHEFGHWGSKFYTLLEHGKDLTVLMRDHRNQDMQSFSVLSDLIKNGNIKKFMIVDHHPFTNYMQDYCLYTLQEKYPDNVIIVNLTRDVKGLKGDDIPCSSEFHYLVSKKLADKFEKMDMSYDKRLEHGNPYAIAAMHGIFCDAREDVSLVAREIRDENPMLNRIKSPTGRYSIFIQNNAIFNSAICKGWDEGAKRAEESLLMASLRKTPSYITAGSVGEEKIPRGDFSRSLLSSLRELYNLSNQWNSGCLKSVLKNRNVIDITDDPIANSMAFVYLDGEVPLFDNYKYNKYMGRADDFYIHRVLTNSLCSSFRGRDKPELGVGVVSYKSEKKSPAEWRIRGSARLINRASQYDVGKACNMFVRDIIEMTAETEKISSIKNIIAMTGTPRGGGHRAAGAIDIPYRMAEIVLHEKPFYYLSSLFADALRESKYNFH